MDVSLWARFTATKSCGQGKPPRLGIQERLGDGDRAIHRTDFPQCVAHGHQRSARHGGEKRLHSALEVEVVICSGGRVTAMKRWRRGHSPRRLCSQAPRGKRPRKTRLQPFRAWHPEGCLTLLSCAEPQDR